jgi:hypothetical protein
MAAGFPGSAAAPRGALTVPVVAAAVAAPAAGEKTYTMAEVEAHSSEESAWFVHEVGGVHGSRAGQQVLLLLGPGVAVRVWGGGCTMGDVEAHRSHRRSLRGVCTRWVGPWGGRGW